jgi:hypothetical protein
LLYRGEGVLVNKSLAAHYFKLSADQNDGEAQYMYAVCLLEGQGVQKNDGMGAHYLQHAADAGVIQAQVRYASMLHNCDKIPKKAQMSAHYYKLAADQGSIEGQLRYASCLLHSDGIGMNMVEAERYFRLACDQGDSTAHIQYGIALFSGMFGRFDFTEAQTRFEAAASSNRFALILRDALSRSDDQLVTPDDFYESGAIFSLMRCQSDGGISVIRIMNPHLCHRAQESTEIFKVWKEMVESSIGYLLDLSHIEYAVLGESPTDLTSCSSVQEMISLIFRIQSIESSLYKNVNHFLRCFPIQVLGKFMKELRGVLSYIYLLQSSIDIVHAFNILLNRGLFIEVCDRMAQNLLHFTSR